MVLVMVVVELQLAIKDYSTVSKVWGGRHSVVVKVETEILHSFSTGGGVNDDDV